MIYLLCFLWFLSETSIVCSFGIASCIKTSAKLRSTTLCETKNHYLPFFDPTRRSFMITSPLSIALVAMVSPQPALATLVKFPCTRPLLNTYHLMRAGTSMLEAEDIWSTNPLFLTNREDALSSVGQEQVLQACQSLLQIPPTIIEHSLAATCIDTANLIQRELKLGGDRVLPEFTYLDPRAIGKWDMLRRSDTFPAVVAYDNDEAGKEGLGARPPPNEDGTPNETLADQTIRLRQILSLLESRTSGENILLIFPDGTGPALLSAMMAGIPLNQVHLLEFAPGEVRLDVTRDSVLAKFRAMSNEEKESYQELLQQGRVKLNTLQNNQPVQSLKDQRDELEQQQLDQELIQRQQDRQLAAQQADEKRQQRLRAVAAQRQQIGSHLSLDPMAAGAASVVAFGGLLAVAMQPNDTELETESFLNEAMSLESAAGSRNNSAQSSLSRADVGQNGNMIENVAITDSERLSPTTEESRGIKSILYESTLPTINGMIPAKEKSDDRAMKSDYLDQEDDGSDAWIQTIVNIIHEDDTQDIDDEGNNMTPLES